MLVLNLIVSLWLVPLGSFLRLAPSGAGADVPTALGSYSQPTALSSFGYEVSDWADGRNIRLNRWLEKGNCRCHHDQVEA